MTSRAFAACCAALVLICVLLAASREPAIAQGTATWGHARIAQRNGHSVFEVDGKPFFLYGAAFFYERLPRDRWQPSMETLHEMGINTLDLYVPWNWHERSDGDFDFSGRTNPRRDLDEVLRLAKTLDFEIVLRPGPVVRNEWRNGGYPAWLLERPEYAMPLHDILEGRYPATATLQNQHSDDAAAQWMRNATHVKYAKRWLERVLREVSPYADRVLAIALDDDQGAYIDNQTYPAPHFNAYLAWLRDTVHGVTGANELTFINTYQMKVPASSPVWAMGNWYQSDAYAIGAHDESQLAFTFGQLATRPHQPLFASEFQAGWLQGAGEAYPRKADSSNTLLALATMVGSGVRGVVTFPAQDTLDPAGWDAPWANLAYAWDAALKLDGTYAARYWPTAQFGALVGAFGGELAQSFPRYDASIVYAGGDVDPSDAGGATFPTIAGAAIGVQQACRSANIACTFVDLSAIGSRDLPDASLLLLPPYDVKTRANIERTLRTRLRDLHARGIRVAAVANATDIARAMRGRTAIVEHADDAVFSQSLSGDSAGFLSVTNYGDSDKSYPSVVIHVSSVKSIALAPFVVRAHQAIVSPVDARLKPLFPPGDVLRFTDCMPVRWDIRPRDISAGYEPSRAADHPDRPFGNCSVTVSIAGATQRFDLSQEATERLSFDDRSSSRVFVDPTPPPRSPTPGPEPLRLRPGVELVPAPGATRDASTDVAVFGSDVFRDGSTSIVYRDAGARLIVSPDAGARSFFFADAPGTFNWFTTVGGLRDDVAIEGPTSTTDRIARYTHDFPAGTFNRTYDVSDVTNRSAHYAYVMPDAFPHGATFDRTIALVRSNDAQGFDLDERARFSDVPAGLQQRAVSVSSFPRFAGGRDDFFLFAPDASPIVTGETHVVSGNGFAIGDPQQTIVVAWHAGDVEKAEISERADSEVARLTLAPSRRAHIIFRTAYRLARSPADMLQMAANEAQVTPSPARTP